MAWSFDLFMWVGGYWSQHGLYMGGDSHTLGRMKEEGFGLASLNSILANEIGIEDTQMSLAWFPPRPESREELTDDDAVERAVSYGVKQGALTIFAVRVDDPYLNGPIGELLGDVSSEDEAADNAVVSCESGDSSEDDDTSSEDEENHEDNRSEPNELDPQETEEHGGSNESGERDELLVQESDSDSYEAPREELDESKYKRFELGQSYATIPSFKSAITEYAVKKKYDISFFKSDSKKVVAVCSNRKCPWRICASINSSSTSCVVRSLQEDHSCTWKGRVTLLNKARIAELYEKEFRVNPYFSATQLQAKLDKKNINVTWTVCERTRLRVFHSFDVEQAESFTKMFDYVHELKRSNSGTTAECEAHQSVFYRFYVCFGALKHGWKASCRRIIHVDRTFLKWRMTGMLLVACGRDPNDQMFPLAWGIVDSDTKDNWLWFFEHLINDLGLESGNGLTMMSDQCKGLIGAVSMVLPFAEHRLCDRHVYHNWKKQYNGAEYEDLFWGAAKAYYMADFKKKMEELKSISQEAYDHLKVQSSCPWSRAFLTDISTCDAVENNLGESFNAAIQIARTKPIVEMLEEIRRKVLVSNEKKRLESQRPKGLHTPRAKALLDYQINLSKHCRPLHCGMGKYEVGNFNRFVVHMREEIKCACRMYQTAGIACCHIVSALRLEKNADQDPSTLISDWFSIDKLQRCYEVPMEPVNGMNMWVKTTDVRVLPPPYKKPPERPPGKKRRREKGEPREKGKMSKVGIKMHCSNYGQGGHNKLKCPKPHVPKHKKPNGRPRKHPISTTTPSQASLDASQLTQASQAAPSISAALPRPRPGRPRRAWFGASTSAQEASAQPTQANYDAGPIQLPREGFRIFTSPQTGDDYISDGSRVVDTSDNTILPTDLFKAKDRKKMAVRGRGRGKGRGRGRGK